MLEKGIFGRRKHPTEIQLENARRIAYFDGPTIGEIKSFERNRWIKEQIEVAAESLVFFYRPVIFQSIKRGKEYDHTRETKQSIS